MLTEKYRPARMSDVIGQDALAGSDGLLTKMLQNKDLRSCIFYGPPGTGKSTIAKIMAEQSGIPFVALNATNAKLDDIRNAVKTDSPVLVYLDEIQYWNKKQQQSLLPYVEDGTIILIGATTDNPYHSIIDALLSRCLILEFKRIPKDKIQEYLTDTALKEGFSLEADASGLIAENCAGDMRRALNMLDTVIMQSDSGKTDISADDVTNLVPSSNMSGFDMAGNVHYNLIAALQKSIRGSDPNAAVFYLARLLEGGDILSPCRRLLVIAHEDIGLANPEAMPFVQACVDAAQELGMPEASKPLTNAVIMLAISPKCCTAEPTYNAAKEDIHNGLGGTIPSHLCQPFKGYKYPHDYPHHWVRQQYLPDDLTGRVYYTPGDNEFEQSMADYWSKIMK